MTPFVALIVPVNVFCVFSSKNSFIFYLLTNDKILNNNLKYIYIFEKLLKKYYEIVILVMYYIYIYIYIID